MPPDLPLLLLATADVPVTELEPSVQELFHGEGGWKDETARLAALLTGAYHICNGCSAGVVHLHLLPVLAAPS